MLVIAASLSFVAMAYGFVVDLRARNLKGAWGSGGTLLFAVLTIVAARRAPMLHPIMAALVLGSLLFQSARSDGQKRITLLVGALTWAVALICGRILF